MDHSSAGEPSLSGAGCGPSALQDLLGFGKEQKASSVLAGVVPGPKGYSLSQLLDLSDKLMMGLQMAKREPGAEVVIPCVVHWKVGHYSALVEKKTIKGANGEVVYYRSHDPLFGVDGWISKKALDEEGSGYYLVADGNLPSGWEKVEAGEGLVILGRGPITYTPTPTPTCTCQATPACPTCNGMVVASMDMGNVSATMNDTPLHYRPQVGPMMSFSLAYQQKTVDPLPGSNFGPNWNFNWQGYVVYNYGSGTVNYTLVARSGGAVSFRPGGFVPNLNDNIVVGSVFDSSHGTELAGLPSSFILETPDGGAEVYSTAEVGAGTVNILLTQVIDAQGNAVSIEYDGLGRVSGIMDAVGQTSVFSYGDDNPANPDSYLVAQITDPFTRNAVFTYTNGLLTAIQDQLGLVSSMTYGTDTNYPGDWVSTLTTPYGTTRFDYTGTGSGIQRELDISDPVGLSEHMRFIEVQPVTDDNTALPQGMIVTNSWLDYRNTFYWDKKAMADAPLSPSSATVYHWLHAGNQPEQALTLESLKKPLEARIWYNYPGQTDPLRDLNITMFQPSITARVLADGSTQATTKTYNSFGNMTLIVDPKGRSVTYIYDTNGIDLLSEKDSQGDVLMAQTYFPGTHNVETRTDAAGQTTHYTYNNAGQVLTMRTPMNETTNYAYDGSGNLLSVTPPQQGAGVTYTYDQLGRVSTQTDAVRGTLTYSYDSMDRVVRVDYPDGTHEITAYYRLDVQSTTDRQGRTTSYTYDGDRRKITMTDPKQQTTNYGWCACGSMTSLQDPKGNTTRWTYDLEGRVVQKTYPDTSSYTYLYDPAVNRLILMTDAKRQETQYSYDEDDKLIGVNYIGGLNNTPPVAYQYDQDLGRLTNMEDGTGSTGYSYGTIGQVGGNLVKNISQPVGDTTANISYTYDNDGRVINRTIDGAQESYGFNGVGQLTQVQNPLGPFGYTYDSNSARLTQVSYPNGQQTNMDYYTAIDPNGASGSLKDLTNLGGGITSGQTLSKFSYAYNPTGEIKTWQQQLDNNPSDAKTYGMGYDQDSELQGVTLTSGTSGFDGLTSNQSVSYGYDASGNRTVEQAPKFMHTFGTNNLNQLTNETANPISVLGFTNRPASVLVNATPVPENTSSQFQTSIQPQGNQTPLTILAVAPDGTTTSQKNHVLSTTPFTYDADGNETSSQQYNYSWDAANRLVGVSIIGPVPTTQANNVQMTYDGSSRRVSITELHGTTVLVAKTFVWCGKDLCQQRDVTGHTVTNQFFTQGEQINGTNYYFVKDHLGSVREMTDSNGVIHANYDYDPYGRQVKLSGDQDSDFGYTGFYFERALWLDLTWYRAYDSNEGRWLSRDPLAESQGLNLYKYAKNSPDNFTDPNGLKVYVCEKALWGLPGKKVGPDWSCNPLYHEYICVNGTCFGQGPAGNPILPGPGTGTNDTYSPSNCHEIPSCPAMEKCLLGYANGGRPTYEFVNAGGTNCQAWASQILAACSKKCCNN